MEEIYTTQNGITEEEETGLGAPAPLSVEEAQVNALSTLAATAADLSRAVSKIAAYVPTQWVDNSEPSINATRLMHIENGIRDATNAVNNAIDSITSLNSQVATINGSFTLEGSVNKNFTFGHNRDTPMYVKARDAENGFYQLTLHESGGDFSKQSDSWYILWQLATKSDLGNLPYGVYDLNNAIPNAFIATNGSTNLPELLHSNSVFCLQMKLGNDLYDAQLCFSFGADKIAIRRKANSTAWSDWKYFTAS